MVIAVGDNNSVRAADGYVMRMLQLASLVAERSEFTDEGSVRLENLPNENSFRSLLSRRVR